MAIRFEEEYDPERNGIGLRPMGRNAAGNRGISLKKGDYVIGAAITRFRRHARQGTRRMRRASQAHRQAHCRTRRHSRKPKQALTKAREDYRNKLVDSAKVSDC